MAADTSRYRKQPAEVTVDARGRRLMSRRLRPPPQVHGAFTHTVADGDRLDRLAWAYYHQPRRWWRICDANPAFLDPQDLLGGGPIVTDRFPLRVLGDGDPPWAPLLAALRALVGVEDALLADADDALLITYNQRNLRAADLADAIGAAGFAIGQPRRQGRAGKPISIPPDGAE